MVTLIKSYMFSATAKDSFVMLFGAISSTIIGFFITLILTRNLSPFEFGLFITALTFTQLIADLSELGINSAILNYVSSSNDREKLIFKKASFLSKVIIATILSMLIFLFSSQISLFVFKNLLIAPLIKISAIGIFLTIILSWYQVVFQSEKKFFLSMLVNSSINLFRILLVGGLLALGLFGLINTYLAFQLSLVVIAGLFFLKLQRHFLGISTPISSYRQIFAFGLPVGIGFSLAALYTKLDQILIFNLVGSQEAGIYGLAFRVSASLIFATGALTAAITPRFASLGKNDFFLYFKKTILASFGLSLVSVFTLMLAPFIMPLLFGSKFSNAIIPFQILLIGIICFTITAPFSSAIIYKFKKTKFQMIISLISLGLTWGLLNLLIPIYKSSGAAIAVSLVYGFQMVTSLLYFFLLQKEERKI